MLLTGWTAKCWICAVIYLFLILTRQATSEPITSNFEQRSREDTEITDAVCSFKGWREVQAGFFQLPTCTETRWESRPRVAVHGNATTIDLRQQTPTASIESSVSASSTAVPTTEQPNDQELDTDSPLDNANFLSFEDWKKQNLAKVGQSVENVSGNRRATAAAKGDRRRPTGINNALDSFGDEAEIELDFGGFGAEPPTTAKPTSWGMKDPSQDPSNIKNGDGRFAAGSPSQGVEWTGTSRRHDAGTTCKERFNYASFDCAATVLKTNPECKGSSSVLVENKDSYMLNECRAQNKFLILELCDDILVDTVVLANYEFFSSIFRTFKVSVSDRYPAKPDQWKELGVYEGRNTREVQAFAVENPLIWARYLKIELLTHYGSEFYCPLSLIRVHGTTMMEEYKHDWDGSRIDEVLGETTAEPSYVAVENETELASDPLTVEVGQTVETEEKDKDIHAPIETSPNPQAEIEMALFKGRVEIPDFCPVIEVPPVVTGSGNFTGSAQTHVVAANATIISGDSYSSVQPSAVVGSSKETGDVQKTVEPATVNVTSTKQTDPASVERNATAETETKPSIVPKEEQISTPESIRPTVTQPPSPNPTTQESFFKSVNKRLQMLESNSTLSLLYIEEQSRILRDAFSKVEKRQLAKTISFLENLNTTVRSELKQFRQQYEEVWKSVASEFDHQNIQYHQEIYSLSRQMSVLADELVFQKRVSVVQSVMVLFCFGLVLFSRGPVSSYLELPSVQNMVSRSYGLRASSPIFASRSPSPSSPRAAPAYHEDSGHRRNISSDSQASDFSSSSPITAYDPRTPISDGSSGSPLAENMGQPEMETEPIMIPVSRTESSPAVLTTTSDDIDEDEVLQSSKEE